VTARRDVPVVLGIWLITVVGQASVGPAAEVKVAGGRIQIHATAVSVSEILDRLSRTTGMKVVYEGAPPTDRLTAAIDAGSETEALSRLLEGLGLTYAFKVDAGGRHVETLFVTNASSRRTSTASTTSPASGARIVQLATEDYDVTGVAEDQDPANDPTAAAPATPEGTGMVAVSPGYVAGQVGGVPTVVDPTQNPAFPSGASFPTSPVPGNPGFPAFPGPASYP
jgi:hypothetical protein